MAHLTVVCGPPCSGKTSYVTEHAAPGDLVYDFDRLAEAIGSPDSHDHPAAHRRVLRLTRRATIDEMIRTARLSHVTCWIIDTAPHRTTRAMYRHKGMNVVLLNPGQAVILDRARDRGDATAVGIADWYRTYTETRADAPAR